MVALRDFDFGEIIMAERCVASSPEEIGELEPASVRAAAMLLVPAPTVLLVPIALSSSLLLSPSLLGLWFGPSG